MPRQARLDAPGVLQHVMARGIERRKIFWDDKDRSSFLERLAFILEETQTQCYAWTLIPNHFHLLLRTGPTPLSKVMRRLMTGYAVTFNLRHRRAGHLFQNRYKSVVCEEDSYLLELTRYIHLNPLRAGIVNDLKELDKYPWTGHSALLGKRKNPLIPKLEKEVYPVEFKDHSTGAKINPENPVNPVRNNDKFLAEKTLDEVLRHFGSTLNDARQHYRAFVEKGIKHGRRPELQGGGLVRSAGGDASVLFSKDKENRELSDQRVLGSGGFVGVVLQESERLLEKKYKPKRSIEELIEVVAGRLSLKPKLICSGSRQQKYSEARSLVAWLAVEETGHPAAEVARFLGISRVGVKKAVGRGMQLKKQGLLNE